MDQSTIGLMRYVKEMGEQCFKIAGNLKFRTIAIVV